MMNLFIVLAESVDGLKIAQGVLALITGLVGLISAAVGAYFAIKNFIKATKSKNANEIWSMMMSMADAAIKEAEKSQKTGADKKKMVIESVKAGCKSAGLDISNFLDQLDAYIDQTISFVNQMKK